MAELAKPDWGMPCNGCGMCCKRQVCAIGLEVHGKDTPAPCPSLVHDGSRYLCAVVCAEQMALNAGEVEDRHLAKALGIGWGCDSDNPTTKEF